MGNPASKLKSEKEKIYDEQISPLMKQIIKICKEHKIPLFADFGFDPVKMVEDEDGRYPADSCRTSLIGEGYDHHFVFDHFNALHQCRMLNKSIHIDKYLTWVIKQVEELGIHGSFYLGKMGISPTTGKMRE